MLILLFLGTSTSNNALEETSPSMAVGSGVQLHTDILIGRSTSALGPLWNAAWLPKHQWCSLINNTCPRASRYDCTLAGTNGASRTFDFVSMAAVYTRPRAMTFQIDHCSSCLPHLSPTPCWVSWTGTQLVIRLRGRWLFAVRNLASPEFKWNWALNFPSLVKGYWRMLGCLSC